MILCFAVLSAKEIAFRISFSFLLLFANRTAISKRAAVAIFVLVFLLLTLNALFAVFVTGIFFPVSSIAEKR